MIFATLCVGIDWCEKHSQAINDIGENHTIYVYTDCPHYFPNCNIIQYTRSDFSYFEKLVLLFNVMDECNERVTYFDCDSTKRNQVQLMLNGLNQPFDNKSIYTYKVFKNVEYSIEDLSTDPSLYILMNVYRELGFKDVRCNYPHERILSLPFIPKKYKKLKEKVLNVQPIWEKNWSMGKAWIGTHPCNKWSQYGCGYAEGGALSIYAKELKINLEPILPITTLL